jgi:uncharacterized protein GlcG (DUF336 family)
MFRFAFAIALVAFTVRISEAQPASAGCSSLPSHGTLKAALDKATAEEKSGLNNHMWATIVDRDGVVCAVAFSGTDRASQWGASRVISAQKASTAASLGLDSTSSSAGSGQAAGLALSTANLFSAVQPGGSLFGLQESNPVNAIAAYAGPYASYGTAKDPMVNHRIGGINVFGGGLPLYNADRVLVGGIGVSGDSSCADHNVAYRTRHALNLDFVPAGVSGNPSRRDTIVYDITPQAGQMPGISAGGWGHPECFAPDVAAEATLPDNQ